MARMSQHRLAVVVFAIIMGAFGVFNIFHPQMFQKQIPSYLPGGIIWIYITGAIFILCALAILLNIKTKTACYFLGGMLVVFILLIHVPIIASGESEEVRQMELLMMLKDVGLAMAAFLVGYNSDRPDGAPNL